MARKSLPRPTSEYLLGRLEELNKTYKDDLALLENIRELRSKTWEINVPQKLKDITDATGLEHHDATVAAELLELPRLYLDKLPDLQLHCGKLPDRLSGLPTRMEMFTKSALFEDIGSRGTGPSTLHRMVDATFEGGGWTKLVKTPDRWAAYNEAHEDDYADDKPGVDPKDGKTKYERYEAATEEMKKKAGLCVEWVHVDAATLRPDFAGGKLTAMFEVQKRSIAACGREYGFAVSAEGIVPERTTVKDWGRKIEGSECELIMYRDAEWMSYLIRWSGSYDGTTLSSVYEIPGYTRRHKYNLGHPGYYSSLGWTKNFEYGRLVTWSAAEPKAGLVKYLSWLRSIYAYVAVFQAMPPVSVETPPEAVGVLDADTGQPKAPEKYEAGMQYHGVPGTRRVPLVLPSNMEHIQAEIVQTAQEIGRLSPARKSGELGDLGGEGFALSTVYEKDRARYGAFEDSIIQHLTGVTLDLWKLLEQEGEDVYVFRNAKKDGGYIKVTPKDFEVAMRPTWSLYVDSTAANIIKQRYAEAMEKAGYWSKEQAIEFMGQNFDTVTDGKALDRVMASPWFQEHEDAEVAAVMGRGAWLKKQQQAQQMAAMAAASGVPGGPVPPGTQGAGGMPGDTAAMTMSPNGAGAQPGQEFRPTGIPASPAVQTQGATAQVSGGQV